MCPIPKYKNYPKESQKEASDKKSIKKLKHKLDELLKDKSNAQKAAQIIESLINAPPLKK